MSLRNIFQERLAKERKLGFQVGREIATQLLRETRIQLTPN